MILTIDPEGRVTLPQSVLDGLNVAPGDCIEFEINGYTVKFLRREVDSVQPEESEN